MLRHSTSVNILNEVDPIYYFVLYANEIKLA